MKSSASELLWGAVVADGLPEEVRRLLDSVLRSPASSDPKMRQDLFARAVASAVGGETVEVEAQIERYCDNVARWAYKVLDEEVEALSAFCSTCSTGWPTPSISRCRTNRAVPALVSWPTDLAMGSPNCRAEPAP